MTAPRKRPAADAHRGVRVAFWADPESYAAWKAAAAADGRTFTNWAARVLDATANAPNCKASAEKDKS